MSKKKISFAVCRLPVARIPLIAYSHTSYDFDMFVVCESMLINNISNHHIFIKGFFPDPFRSDKDFNTRNGGVCLYCKESLPIMKRCHLEILSENIVVEITLTRKKVFIDFSYRHPNMSNDELVRYMRLLENIDESMRK